MNSAEILKSTETDTFSQNLISSDIDLLNKVKQVIELTGCSNDVAVTALFDSNNNIEVAIDKIFEQTQRNVVGEPNKINSDWKEVAKYKKKQSSIEMHATELNVSIDSKESIENKAFIDKSRPVRGSNRGRARFSQNGRNYESVNNKIHNGKDETNDGQSSKILSRGRGKRTQYRLNTNQGRSKHHNNQEIVFDENIDQDSDKNLAGEPNKWNAHYDTCNDWLSDSPVKSNEFVEFEKPFDNHHRENLTYHNSNSALNMEKFETNLIVSCVETERVELKEDAKVNQLNPLELVAKGTNKVNIFGEFSRTKAPAPSSKVPLEPVKLLTSTGVMSAPMKTGFSFGLNFNEYSQSTKSADSSESFISKIISNQPFDGISSNKCTKSSSSAISQENCPEEFLQSNFSEKESQLSSASCVTSNLRLSGEKPVIKSKSDVKSNDMYSNVVVNNQRSIEIPADKKLSDSNTNYKLPDCISNNHQNLNTTILSSSSQLCPPPGMSNAHLLQQFQNNPQYFSLLNIPNGSSIFSGCNMNQVNEFSDIGTSDENQQVQQSFIHSESNKEFNQKASNSKQHNICSVQSIPNSSTINQNQVMLSKISDSDNNPATHSSTILSAMPMSNICCFPQVYMNNFPNFMPTVQGHNASSQSSDVNQSSVPNKQIYNLSTHRNYSLPEEYDELIPNKPKFQRTPNYVSNFVGKSQDDGLDVEKSTKLANNTAQINRQPNTQNIGSSNRANQHQTQQQQQQQQTVSNDTRFLTFHHQHSNHPYQNNMFNCVTATGAHPTAPHPYAMAHQGGGIQQFPTQLHLMQQQMHNFSPSYQFQEHLMTSMVSNPSSRNNISQGSGSSGNQSRNNRPSNQLWHPSN